jgi:hypothetical protein
MANSFNDLSLVTFKQDTLRPQSFTSTGAGLTVDISTIGTNLVNALLSVGAVNTFTSLAVKMQASNDDSNWVDISGATFTTVTAANNLQLISFQVPPPASATAAPYKYVRAYFTLTGTSCLTHCVILGCLRYPNATATASSQNSPPAIN